MPTPVFKKGKSGNPSGRPKLPRHVREFKRYSYDYFIEKIQEFFLLTKGEMAAKIKDPNITMFDLMFATVVSQASQGDKDARNVIIDRLWGKVKEELEIKTIKPFIIQYANGEQTVLGAKVIEGELK